MESGIRIEREPHLGSHVALLGACIGLSAAVRGSTAANVLFVIPALGLVLIAVLRQTRLLTDESVRENRFFALVWSTSALIALSAVLEVRLPRFGPSRELFWYWSATVWLAVVLVFFWVGRRDLRRLRVLVWSVVALIAVEIAVLILVHPAPGIDVFNLHNAAATRLGDLSSPYQDLNVLNTSPYAETSSEIDGYPYPPVTLLWYSLGSWAGDPRIASALAWLITIATMTRLSLRESSASPELTGVLLLLVANPGWVLVIDQSWTEPLTLMLIVTSLVYWRRQAFAAGILVGLAIASKQYMIIMVPAVVVATSFDRRRRVLGMFIGGALPSLPFMITDFEALWQSVVSFHLSSPIRPDASNLAGLGAHFGHLWSISAWVTLAVPAAVAWLIAHRVRDAEGIAIASVAGLSLFFFLASQAFANYWFLVYGLAVLWIALGYSRTGDHRLSNPESSPSDAINPST